MVFCLLDNCGTKMMWLECDALNLVTAVQKNKRGAAPVFLHHKDIAGISLSFDAFRCEHVRRSGKTVAHLVARWVVSNESEVVWLNNFPRSFVTLVES